MIIPPVEIVGQRIHTQKNEQPGELKVFFTFRFKRPAIIHEFCLKKKRGLGAKRSESDHGLAVRGPAGL